MYDEKYRKESASVDHTAFPKKKKKNWLGYSKAKNESNDPISGGGGGGLGAAGDVDQVIAAPPTKRPEQILMTKLYTVVHAGNPARVLAPIVKFLLQELQ